MVTPGPTGGLATTISPVPVSCSKSSAATPGGGSGDLSGGAPRLKSRLSSPPSVIAKRQREVGSSEAEGVGVSKRGRVVLSSESDDDGATLTLIMKKRSGRSSQPEGDVPLPVLDVAEPSFVPITAAPEAGLVDGGGIPTTVEEGLRSPAVDTAQRRDPGADPELDALTPENVELVTARTLAQVRQIRVCFLCLFNVFD
ncbi:hypothetical protein PanWU01x14_155450 [Parasponia andersonii]|uniref:Uncharacterized protein n=1 Tax=Parasponia andersonii TaxID=3476 RepID=A0A2P5CG61_PARAD|nr:hypothetical protein PanWU01x14_155450 [Parasponia andersonii]